MRQHCIHRRVTPLAYSFEKRRTVLQVSNSHNSSSFSSRVTGSVKFTIWHLVEEQREDLWNRLGNTLPMGHVPPEAKAGDTNGSVTSALSGEKVLLATE